MAQINKPNLHFNTVLYTGTGSSNSVTGVGFQPDFTWIKQRSGTEQNVLFDSIRGATKYLASSSTAVEATTATTLTSFDSDGFTEGGHGMTGQSSATYLAYNWLAGGTSSSNTDGTITSTVTANQTAGFSIVKWAGDSSASATVGHGLGATPACIICKEMNGTDYWHMYHQDLTADYNLFPNVTNAETKPTDGTLTNATSTTFGFQGATNVVAVNESGKNNIAYCFAEKKGYSKFGSYTGNGNADGTFVYLGFKPAFILWKKSSGVENWGIANNKSSPFNIVNLKNRIDSQIAEATGDIMDFTSNGFKIRTTSGEYNSSGGTYIYMAFAEQPLVGTNNIPCTAR